MRPPPSVTAWLDALEPGPRAAFDALRTLMVKAVPHLTDIVRRWAVHR